MIGDLGKSIEAIYRRKHLAPFLGEQRFCRPADGFTIVHDQNFEPVQTPRSII
jgi:hypothetical protein